jgi:hypothetical protein
MLQLDGAIDNSDSESTGTTRGIQLAEVKPDWCDPNPANPKTYRKAGSISGFSNPNSPLVSGYSTPDRASPVGKEWFCDMCHGLVPQRKEIHYASLHFKEKLKAMLPTQAPFICPDNSCKAEHKHFLNLSTHFLTQHGHLQIWFKASHSSSKNQPVQHLFSNNRNLSMSWSMTCCGYHHMQFEPQMDDLRPSSSSPLPNHTSFSFILSVQHHQNIHLIHPICSSR